MQYTMITSKDIIERIDAVKKAKNLSDYRVTKKANLKQDTIGFGTATLTTKLYENGCIIYGQDFSSRMIELASAKMPDAHLYQGDFSRGLAEPLKQNSYDFIVATYSIHHLTDRQKIAFLEELLNHLKEGGKILIGDVAFESRDELDKCRDRSGDEWDDDEIYCVADELKLDFPDLRFEKVTFCSGILMLGKMDE